MKPAMRTITDLRNHGLLLCIAILALGLGPAGPAHRVKDINTTPGSSSGGVGSAIVVGDTLYFIISTYGISDELWKSDGTTAGTERISGIGTLTRLRFLTAKDDILYFAAIQSGFGDELWRTDGTAEGTRMVRDINPGRGDSGVRSLVDFRGELYFGADDGVHGYELWKTDGTRDGTVLAADLTPGSKGSALFGLRASDLRASEERLYFSESSPSADSPATLYSTDGTVNGTRPVRQFVREITSNVCTGFCISWPPGDSVSFDGLTYLLASDGVSGLELWRTDGTSFGTALVKDICPGKCSAFAFSDGVSALDGPQVKVINGRLIFFADDGVHGREPWTSDGTEAGTRLVKDVHPGPETSSFGYGVTPVGSAFVFPVFLAGGWEMWRSDGTEAGTFLVGSHAEDSGGFQIAVVGDTVFFSAGLRLWKTDSAGTPASLVSEFLSKPTRLVNLGGSLYFTAPGPSGFSLWKTNESPIGSEVVRALSSGSNASSDPQPLGELDGSLLFFAGGGSGFSGLFRTDGTEAGTQPVARVFLGGTFLGASGLFAPFRGSIFFDGSDGIHGAELWRTDGTPGGTRLVKDIAVPGGTVYPYINDSLPCALTAVGDTLYFGATDGERGNGLWKSDGTESGTEFIKDLAQNCYSRPAGLVPFNGLLYFSGGTPSFQAGLWRTNGTGAGTELVRPVAVSNLASTNGRLIFSGTDAPEGNGLWASDGTAAGTVILRPFSLNIGPFARTPSGAFFLAPALNFRSQLWRTDGTVNGTILLADFALGPREIVAIGTRVFVAGVDAEHGVELWTSDGTPAGTRIVKDIAAGKADSLPRNLTAIGGVLLFAAQDPIHGEELWQSDGTEEGTFLVQDIAPGPASASPGNFTTAGPLVYFTADDGETGVELWAMPLSALVSAPNRTPRLIHDRPADSSRSSRSVILRSNPP